MVSPVSACDSGQWDTGPLAGGSSLSENTHGSSSSTPCPSQPVIAALPSLYHLGRLDRAPAYKCFLNRRSRKYRNIESMAGLGKYEKIICFFFCNPSPICSFSSDPQMLWVMRNRTVSLRYGLETLTEILRLDPGTRMFVKIPVRISVSSCPGFPVDSDGKESAYNAGDLCSIPGSGRCPGEGYDLLSLRFLQKSYVNQKKLVWMSVSSRVVICMNFPFLLTERINIIMVF